MAKALTDGITQEEVDAILGPVREMDKKECTRIVSRLFGGKRKLAGMKAVGWWCQKYRILNNWKIQNKTSCMWCEIHRKAKGCSKHWQRTYIKQGATK